MGLIQRVKVKAMQVVRFGRLLVTRQKYVFPKIVSVEETLEEITSNQFSVARFGDGEFMWALGIDTHARFQQKDEQLREGLKKVLGNTNPNLLICVPPQLSGYKMEGSITEKLFWSSWIEQYYHRLLEELNFVPKTYYNAEISRFYSLYQSSNRSASIITLWRNLWKERNVVIIEGEHTRFGVGNDFLSTAKSVRRIIAPAENAYSKYSEILDAVGDHKDDVKNPLFLLALGPTATLLACDLTDLFGLQAVDVGHADIQYEWYLRRADHKIAIPGKYVNEVNESQNVFTEAEIGLNEDYNKQIIIRIK